MKKNTFNFLGHLFLILISVFVLSGSSLNDMKDMVDIEAALMRGDYALTRTLAQRLIKKNPETALKWKATYYLGESFLRLGEYAQAQEILAKVAKEAASDLLSVRSYLSLADTFFLDGHYQKSVEALNNASSIAAGQNLFSMIYLKYAKAHLKLANWSIAKTYLERIINEHPKSFEVYAAEQLLKEKQYFSVQVGAFIKESKAREFIRELKEKNEYAYIVETTDRQNRKFYRVRIGQLAVLNEAMEVKKRLAREGYPAKIYP